jgi:hypothetical protein
VHNPESLCRALDASGTTSRWGNRAIKREDTVMNALDEEKYGCEGCGRAVFFPDRQDSKNQYSLMAVV